MREYTLAALLLAVGCGGTSPNVGDDQPMIDGGGSGNPDAYVPPSGYTKLIGRTWQLAAGQTDIYRCVRLTLQQDMYITSIEAQAPLGTHHTVMSIASSNVAGPDGEYDCSVQTLGTQMLYASGVGTSPLDFPTNVGLKLTAGTQIHLNLHLYNAGDSGLSGESAIWVKTQPTAPPSLAEMVFAGNAMFSIPSDGQPHDVVGLCSITNTYKAFALWPHMHKLAVHQKIELLVGGSTTNVVTLHDMDYQFAEQKYWLQSPEISLKQGDKVRVTCTYVNNTGATVSFGDGSDKEMCFGGMYRYPSAGSNLFCVF